MFPKLDIVGWYATGEEIQDADMAIHRKVQSSKTWCLLGVLSLANLMVKANLVSSWIAGYGAQ